MTLITSSSIWTILGVFNDKRKSKLDENLELHIAKLYDILVFETDMMKAKEVTSACKKLQFYGLELSIL